MFTLFTYFHWVWSLAGVLVGWVADAKMALEVEET